MNKGVIENDELGVIEKRYLSGININIQTQ